MEITQLLKSNRLPRKQKGQRFETDKAFYLRYYTDEVYTTGKSAGKQKQKAVLLAYKSDLYRSWADVEPLIEKELAAINAKTDEARPTGRLTLTEFVEQHYLPWVVANKAAPTANDYKRLWETKWKPFIGEITLANLRRDVVTTVLTKHAKDGLASRTLSHIKWMLSGVYVWAVAQAIVPYNPVHENKSNTAKWLVEVKRTPKTAKYSLETVIQMLQILEPLDIRAAVAVALAYFAALRPAEIRGLKWEDYDGERLDIKRTVWRNKVGDTKTEDSAASVLVTEPLKSLLEKLRKESPTGFILQYGSGKSLSLDSLNWRTIKPAMEKAGIEWRGYYPGRRGISSHITDKSKNALNSTGMLRHRDATTALKHYTSAQQESVERAQLDIEAEALALIEKQKQTIQ